MGLDERLRKAVREAGHHAVQDIKFTAGLEQRIRHQAALQTRKPKWRRAFIAVSAAVCIVIIGTAWGIRTGELQSAADRFFSALEEQDLQDYTRSSLEPLLQAVPELSGYKMSVEKASEEKIIVKLEKGDAWGSRAAAVINRENGTLEVFKWFMEGEDEHPPAAGLAREKAEAFVSLVAGDEGKPYRLMDNSEIQRPEFGYMDLDIAGRNVAFAAADAAPAISDLSVWVDQAGRIRAFSRMNMQEKKLLNAFAGKLPGLDEALVLEHKSAEVSGNGLVFASRERPGRILVIGSEGGLLSHYRIEASKQVESTDTTPKAVAMERADSLMRTALGEDAKNYRMQGYSNNTVRYVRYLNGLPVLGDDISVAVNESGQIESYDKEAHKYDLSAAPNPAEAVLKTAAEAEVTRNLKLTYVLPQENKEDMDSDRAMLQFTPALVGDWRIDAVSGKMEYGYGSNGMAYDHLPYRPISLQGAREPKLIWTKEQAAELLNAQSQADLTQMKYREYVEGEEEPASTKKKHFEWTNGDDQLLEVVTDTATGRVVEINTPRFNDQIKVSQEEALEAANRFLMQAIDPNVEEVQLSQMMQPGESTPVSHGSWQFEYLQSYQGIPVTYSNESEAYIVAVDPFTGKVHSFKDFSPSAAEKVSYPEPAGVMAKEQAARLFLQENPLQLVYTIDGFDGSQSEPRLVYMPQPGRTTAINAITEEDR
jgi:hypothetical protein